VRKTRRALIVTAGIALMALVVGTMPALAQSEPKAQAPTPIQGELLNVDSAAKMLTVKASDGAEVKFAYTDRTEVTGAKDGVAGLATMKAGKVTVHFTEDAQTKAKTATRIIVQPPSQ
jgi:hypothetical protein